MTPAIDVHTHMLNRDWLELLRAHGRPRYELRKSLDAARGHLSRRRPLHDASAGALRLPVSHPPDGRGGRRPGDHLPDVPERVLGRPRREPQGGAGRQRRHGRRPARVPVAHPLALLAPLGVSRGGGAGAGARLRPGRGGRDGAGEHRGPDAHRPAVRAGVGGDRPARASGPRASDGAARNARHGAQGVQPDREHRLHVRHQPGDRAPHVRRLPGPLPRREADRLARGRGAAVPRRAARSVLRQDERRPDEDVDASRRVHAAALLRLGHVPVGRPRHVHRRRRRRPRPLRLRLSRTTSGT